MDEIGVQFLVALILIIIGGGGLTLIRSKHIAEAEPLKEVYFNLLQELRQNKTDAELKAKVLEAGRVYYSKLRDDQTLTIYDEQAINNDIMASCNGEIENNNSNDKIYEEIRQLAKLQQEGILNNIEFEEKKKQLLQKIV